MMAAELRQAALDYLGAHNVMTLATNGPQGLWAAAVFYASQDFTLYFLSAPHTRHATNIHAEPRIAATIQEDTDDWAAIKGIQLEGQVHLLEGSEAQHAIAQFSAKFPIVTLSGDTPAEIEQAMEGIGWYRITPDRLYLIDNSKGLGHRDEIALRGD